MNESVSYPLIVRGPHNSIEIPERFQRVGGLQALIQKTLQRFSTEHFTLDELVVLIGDKAITDVSQVQNLDLIKALDEGHTAVIQLTDNMRWRINCLLAIFGNGYSAIQKQQEKYVGVFRTGSHMPFGVISKQYLVHDPVSPDIIQRLLLKQKQQPDPTLWMERTF